MNADKRNSNGIRFPLNPTQRQLLAAVRAGYHDQYIWIGPVRQGKGVGSAVAIIDAAIRTCEGGASIDDNQWILAGNTQTSFIRNNAGYLQDAARRNGLSWRYTSNLDGRGPGFLLGGDVARLFLFGGDNQASFQTVRGVTARGAWIDEATLVDDHFFETVIERFSFDDCFLIATSNADAPLHWLKVDYIDSAPDTTLVLLSDFDENQYYSDVRRERLRALDPHTPNYKRQINNEWAADAGLIINIPDKALTDEPFPLRGDIVIDPGVGSTTAALLFVQRSYGWLVAAEYYHNADSMGYRLTEAEHLERILHMWTPNQIIIDPAGAPMRQAARNLGFSARFVKRADNDFDVGVQVVNNVLHSGELKVHNGCSTLMLECATYKWNERERQPEPGPDHLADCIRYGAMDKFPRAAARFIA